MFRLVSLVSILILSAALLARAESPANQLTVAGIAEFTAAYQAWDGARFGAAVPLFRQASTNATATATNFYWLGTAEFHRMLQFQNSPATPTSNVAAAAALDAAVDALTTAVKLDDRHAESHALLGTLYGMKINGSVLRAAWFGPRVAAHRGKALEFGASNPRVQYLMGICQFYTAKNPADWREALRTLLAAEKLFQDEEKTSAGPLDPRWGYDSCLTFLGRTYELLGQRKESVEHFRKALAMHPADHLAKEGLKRTSENK